MAATMTVDVARTLLLEACKASSSDFSTTQQDLALQVSLHDFARRTHCIRATFLQPLAANTWMTTLTAGTSPVPADWVRERTQVLNIQYKNCGTWLVGTAYNAFDMVQNNGTPDAFWYVCTTANTGVQPPNSAYWMLATYDTANAVILATEAMVRDYQIGRRQFDPLKGGCARSGIEYDGLVRMGVPCVAAFRDDTTLVYWPFCKVSVNLAVQYWQPLVVWTAGTASPTGVTLNVPDDYIQRAIVTGSASQLQWNTPAGRMASVEGQAFEALIKEVSGTYAVDTSRISRRAPGIYV